MANTKRPFSIKRTIDTHNETILFTAYRNDGELIPGMSVRFEAKKASAANRHYAMLHGFNQSIGDEAALSHGATLAQKFDAMRERAAYLESGMEAWTTGRGPSEASLLFRAMSEVYADWNPEKVQKTIAGFKEKAKQLNVTWATYQAKLLQSEKLAETVARLRAEEAKGLEIDTDELFAELDSAE